LGHPETTQLMGLQGRIAGMSLAIRMGIKKFAVSYDVNLKGLAARLWCAIICCSNMETGGYA
jgi:hypothetical protein